MARKRVQWFLRGSWWRRLRHNRKYKDKLFRFLFKDKQDLLDLYNALNNTNYTNPEDLEVVTMEDVIFLKMKNDLSFIIGRTLNLYEHQSTVNPNMPLRGLIYFALQYEGMVSAGKDSLFGRKRILLPTPEYVVFYNGTEAAPDETELFLSDSFYGGHGSGCLECRCRVLNINRGHNEGIMKHCRRLWEYSEFVSEVSERLRRGMSTEEAIQAAIDFCIGHDILTDILIRQKTEVLHMLLTEFDEKKYRRTLFRDGYEEGERNGERRGYQRGSQDGERKGYQKGSQDGQRQILLDLISKKLQNNKTVAEIARDLEMDQETVQEIIATMKPEKRG